MVEVASPNVVKYIREFIQLNYRSECTIEPFNFVCNVQGGDIGALSLLNTKGAIYFVEATFQDLTDPTKFDMPTAWEVDAERPFEFGLSKRVQLFTSGALVGAFPVWRPCIKYPYMFLRDFGYPYIAGEPRGVVVLSGFKVSIESEK